jgi:TPR repeat protein
MKWDATNDPASIYVLAMHNYYGLEGVQQNCAKSSELFTRASDLGSSKAHFTMAEKDHCTTTSRVSDSNSSSRWLGRQGQRDTKLNHSLKAKSRL